MNFNDTEQNLLDTWNKIQEGKEKKENVSGIYYNFQQTLSELIETQVRMESGEGDALTDEEKETFNAYDKLFNYETEYGYRCSYSANASDYDHTGECDRDELISYLDGSDEPEEPDFQELVYSCEWDMNFDSNGDLTPQISVFGIKLKEIYQNITPKNVVAPIKENTSTRELSLEIRERKEGLTADDLVAFGNTLMGMVNSFNGDYEINSVGTTYSEE